MDPGSTHAAAAAELGFDARIAARGFDVSLRVGAGETVAILGPNGAGKSTLLGLIAGLVAPDDGAAVLTGRTLFDTAERVVMPPHARGVSLLAQEPLLFPHLSVLDNVAFGPRSAGASARESRAIARTWLDEVDAADLAARRPATLSGGQAQRIAVARALAADPQLLLLDEPFSALDVSAAPALRRLLRRVLADRTVILVTHDVLDALMLADRVLVMRNGRVVEEGPTRRVLSQPRTRFTADLAGLNLVTGIRTTRGLLVDGAGELLANDDPTAPVGVGEPAALAVRPSAVDVSTVAPETSATSATSASSATSGPDGAHGQNVITDVIVDLEPRGDLIRVHSATMAADVPPQAVVDGDLAPGSAAYFSFDPSAATLYRA
jgi:molybdate transport system ATP-binding protein